MENQRRHGNRRNDGKDGKDGKDRKNKNIILGHPNDKPFGPLRNDYKFILYLDEKRWDSVDNYVYSNLLPSIDFRKKTIEHVKPTDVKRLFLDAKSDIDKGTLSSAMKVGIDAKLTADPVFRQKLLDTAGSRILYLSRNNYLGYGNGRGFTNAYGVWLEQFRTGMLWNKARREMNENPEMSNDDIYDSYLAEKGLKMALHFENLDRYLEKENLVEVIRELIKRYGQAKILIIDEQTALALQRKRFIEPITRATHLVRYIRKTFIREVKNRNSEKLKREAFSIFVDDLMEEKYTNDDFDHGDNGIEERQEIMKEQFKTISLSELDSLIQRTWKLFKAGALNKDVSDKIEKTIRDTYIPSNREIDIYENDTVPIPTRKQNPLLGEEAVNEITKDLNAFPLGLAWVYPNLDDPVIDLAGRLEHNHDFDLLSPVNDSVPLKIKVGHSENYLEYPSISHYLVVRIAQTVPGFESMDKAYSLIFDRTTNLFFSVNDAERQLEFIRSEIYNNLKGNLLRKAINTKFEQRMFKDVLLATGNRQLQYGAKEKKENKGKKDVEGIETIVLLQDIREKLLPEGTVIKPSGLKNATDYDEFLENYMTDKVNDISFTIKCVQVYCKHKGLPFTLTSHFVKNVLDSFYGPCTSICKLSKSEKLDPSQSFEEAIETNFRIRRKETSYSMTQKTAKLIYEKIINTLLNLIEVLKSGNQPTIGDNDEVPLYSTLFKVALIKSQWILLTKKVDLKFDTRIKNQNQNKITSALINIIDLLNQRGILKKSHEPVDEVDVKVASSILIGKIQPITEISSSESKRSQLAAETEIEIDEADDEGNEGRNEGGNEGNEEEEGDEEVEGQEYGDELQDFDEDADYEGQVRTVRGHLENLGLRVDHSIEQDIKSASLTVEKLRPKKLKLNFYA